MAIEDDMIEAGYHDEEAYLEHLMDEADTYKNKWDESYKDYSYETRNEIEEVFSLIKKKYPKDAIVWGYIREKLIKYSNNYNNVSYVGKEMELRNFLNWKLRNQARDEYLAKNIGNVRKKINEYFTNFALKTYFNVDILDNIEDKGKDFRILATNLSLVLKPWIKTNSDTMESIRKSYSDLFDPKNIKGYLYDGYSDFIESVSVYENHYLSDFYYFLNWIKDGNGTEFYKRIPYIQKSYDSFNVNNTITIFFYDAINYIAEKLCIIGEDDTYFGWQENNKKYYNDIVNDHYILDDFIYKEIMTCRIGEPYGFNYKEWRPIKNK